jgi:aldehyde:ferredoxin oxidoreductase
MYGWMGKYLWINLTTGEIKEEKIDGGMAADFIGGRGLATKIIADRMDPKVDPFGPGNILAFATGPLTGTTGIAAGRYMVLCKSPLTGTIACSNSGGYFGAELKFAGWDMVFFEGKAEKPVYLYIKNDEVALRDASYLWGKTVHEAEDLLRAEAGEDVKIALIGPGGEKRVRFACVMNDKERAAGRSGVGAVMGSKNLKALVVRGTRGIRVADREGFRQAVLGCLEKVKANDVTREGLPAYGTAILVNIINESGLFPTRNFQTGVFAEADKTGGEAIVRETLIRNKGCFACPIACGRVTRVDDPKFAGSGEGPEYETTWSLGADCGVDDLAAITKAHYITNELGIDGISMGATIACAMELSEKGYLPEADVGLGWPLRFGDAEAVVELTRLTGLREGFGDVLAEGSRRMAERYGHPELFMGVKGQDFPAYDPRGAQGMGLQYATSNRGACHVRGYLISPEILGAPEKLDPHATEGKAQWDKIFQDLTAAIDSSGCCLFTSFALGAPDYAAMLKAATGVPYTDESVLLCGERIWNLERLFNAKAGFTGADDTLPSRMLEEPMPEGPAMGRVVQLKKMLAEYYKLRGWTADGVQTPEKLKALDLA